MSKKPVIINTALTSSAWAALVDDPLRHRTEGASYSIGVRSGTQFKFADNSASNAAFITVDGTLSPTGVRSGTDGIVGYLKSTESTDTAETVVVY